MEKGNEIKGAGNSYTTEFRQYDPRLGRWMSLDRIVKPWESRYAAFANNPVFFIDPHGLDATTKQAENTDNNRPEKKNEGFFKRIFKSLSNTDDYEEELKKSSVLLNEVKIIHHASIEDKWKKLGKDFHDWWDGKSENTGWKKFWKNVGKGLRSLDNLVSGWKGKPREMTFGLSIQGENKYGTGDNDYVKPKNYDNVLDIDMDVFEIIEIAGKCYLEMSAEAIKTDFGKMTNREVALFFGKYFILKPAFEKAKAEVQERIINEGKDAYHNRDSVLFMHEFDGKLHYFRGSNNFDTSKSNARSLTEEQFEMLKVEQNR